MIGKKIPIIIELTENCFIMLAAACFVNEKYFSGRVLRSPVVLFFFIHLISLGTCPQGQESGSVVGLC